LLTYGAEEKGAGPALWLKFDEGYGTTTYDSSDQKNNGTISGASWVTSGCKFGKCLDFDGASNVATVTQAASINLTSKTGYTISTWIYPHSSGESDSGGGQIISKGTNTYLRVDTASGGRVKVSGSLDLDTTDASLSISSAIPLSQWSHIEMTYASSQISIYINGVLAGASVNGVGSPATDSNNLLVGGSTSYNFNGLIDEVKIYPYARTTAQILRDYNQGAAAKIGGLLRSPIS